MLSVSHSEGAKMKMGVIYLTLNSQIFDKIPSTLLKEITKITKLLPLALHLEMIA